MSDDTVILPTSIEMQCRSCGHRFWRPDARTVLSGCERCHNAVGLVQTGRYMASNYQPPEPGHVFGDSGRGTKTRRQKKRPLSFVATMRDADTEHIYKLVFPDDATSETWAS